MAKKKASTEIANHYVTQYGYFYGFRKLLDEYEIAEDKAIQARVELHKHLLAKIREGKREAARLSAALDRLEAACLQGAVPKPRGSSIQQLADSGGLMPALQPVDGWIVSLFETNVSLLAAIHNPETAGIRVNNLKEQFAKLWHERFKDKRYQSMTSFADIFDQTVYLP